MDHGHERKEDGTEYQRTGKDIHEGASGIFQVVDQHDRNNNPLVFAGERYDNSFAQINWKIGNIARRSPKGLGGTGGYDEEGKTATFVRFNFAKNNYEVNYGDTLYFSVSYDGKENVHKVFLNGNLVLTGKEEVDVWSDFLSRFQSIENSRLEVGRVLVNPDWSCWGYLEASVYCMRIYNRALTDEEINKNYEKSVEYHTILER